MARLRETRAFAVKLKDKQQLKNSSPGGAFTAISDLFLANGDPVISPIYTYETCQTDKCDVGKIGI